MKVRALLLNILKNQIISKNDIYLIYLAVK